VVQLTGPGTPYITPAVLTRAPTGINWATIPRQNSSPQDQAAEQANICLRATGLIEGAANQVLRATLDDEWFSAPDYRATIIRGTGVLRVLVSRWPILQTVGGQCSPNTFPRVWTPIAASQMDVDKPPIGLFGASQAADVPDGGQSILVSPGFVDWIYGRNGYRLQLTYISGWPHTSLTVQANSGQTTLQVDDVTGWAPSIYDPVNMQAGATGIFYDGFNQEVGQVIAAVANTGGQAAPAGPGTMTLASPLSFQHGAGVLFTALPRTVMNATIDMASSLALERGATATAVQSMSGGGTSGGPLSVEGLRKLAHDAVQDYARVI
jgi:hypothetical protein